MPSCRITNHTSQPLNICLKQVTALHFENSVEPGQTIKFKALIDDGTKKSRYSVLKSAATIALLSVAVGAAAATAGAALLPEAAALEAIAAASIAGSYLVKGMTVTKVALISHSGTIARLSSVALPKAIDKMSAEFGGLSALQREVLSIVASPSLSSDVRHKATALLKQLHTAYSSDKTARKSKGSLQADPAATLAPLSDEEAVQLEKELEEGKLDDRVEESPIRTGSVLRVHGVYMDKQRHFEIRVGKDGKMELYEEASGKTWT